MDAPTTLICPNPEGESKITPETPPGSWPLDTPGGRFYAEWDDQAPMTREGQLIFFFQFLHAGGRWEECLREFGFADVYALDKSSENAAALEALPEAQRFSQLRAVDSLLDSHQPITLQPDDAGRFLSGLRRRGDWPDQDQVAVYGASPHALLGTAHVRAGELIPERLLNPQEIQSLLESAA